MKTAQYIIDYDIFTIFPNFLVGKAIVKTIYILSLLVIINLESLSADL